MPAVMDDLRKLTVHSITFYRLLPQISLLPGVVFKLVILNM